MPEFMVGFFTGGAAVAAFMAIVITLEKDARPDYAKALLHGSATISPGMVADSTADLMSLLAAYKELREQNSRLRGVMGVGTLLDEIDRLKRPSWELERIEGLTEENATLKSRIEELEKPRNSQQFTEIHSAESNMTPEGDL